MTETEEDYELLKLANEKGKFALQLGLADHQVQAALERGFDNEWVRLIDVSPVAAIPSKIFRIFKLTEKGLERLAKVAPK